MRRQRSLPWIHRYSRPRSIKSLAISGFFLNSGSAFPLGNDSAF